MVWKCDMDEGCGLISCKISEIYAELSLLASIEVLLIIFMRNISILPTAPFHILALLLFISFSKVFNSYQRNAFHPLKIS